MATLTGLLLADEPGLRCQVYNGLGRTVERARQATAEGSGVFVAAVIKGVIGWTVRCDGCCARLGIPGRKMGWDGGVILVYVACCYAFRIISYSRSLLFDAEDMPASGMEECKIEFNAFGIGRGSSGSSRACGNVSLTEP